MGNREDGETGEIEEQVKQRKQEETLSCMLEQKQALLQKKAFGRTY